MSNFARGLQLQLPVFVYGTLRRGQANYWLLRGNTVKELPATFRGGRLYSLRNFPMLIEDGSENVVTGEVMWLHPAYYNRILPDLDRLEGYDPALPPEDRLYQRLRRQVRVNENSVAWAWIYIGSEALFAKAPHEPELIPQGDWVLFQRERMRRVFGS